MIFGKDTQCPPMSLVSWYRHKADQCSLMAKAVTDPRTRAIAKKQINYGLIWQNRLNRTKEASSGQS
jgi:hypothetical protein